MPKVNFILDAGHYAKYNKYTGVDAYESEVMWKLHNYLKEELESYEGATVDTTRTNQAVDLDVAKRGKMAKDHDVLLSLHSNGCTTESVNRVVVIPYQTLSWTKIDDVSMDIAKLLGKVVADTMGVSGYQIFQRKANSDRDGNGVKDDEYYGILNAARSVGVPALIIEHSFHTNKAAAKWLTVDANLKKLAKAEAEALAKYYGLTKSKNTKKIYRVQVGAFSTPQTAASYIAKLKAKGFSDAFVVEAEIKS